MWLTAAAPLGARGWGLLPPCAGLAANPLRPLRAQGAPAAWGGDAAMSAKEIAKESAKKKAEAAIKKAELAAVSVVHAETVED